ncbi:winged-helix domain-containing protein, partial [Clostridium butyricum]
MAGKNISMAVIRRLPKYYRYLGDLLDNDVQRISSKELSEIIGFTASQIRQDLNNFGDFGQQGYGYNVKDLYNQIGLILGLDTEYKALIVGAGNI